jgi:hypothetical protein
LSFAGASLAARIVSAFAIGLRAARAAIKSRHGDFVEFGESAGVGFDHAADVELKRGERGEEVASKLAEARRVAGDQRPPLAHVAMRKRSRPRLFEPESIAFAQAVEDDGFGPFEQAGQGFVSVRLRQRLLPLERGHTTCAPHANRTRRPLTAAGNLGAAPTRRNFETDSSRYRVPRTLREAFTRLRGARPVVRRVRTAPDDSSTPDARKRWKRMTTMSSNSTIVSASPRSRHAISRPLRVAAATSSARRSSVIRLVSGDQRSPHASVKARQAKRVDAGAEPSLVGVAQAIADYRLGPFEQAAATVCRVRSSQPSLHRGEARRDATQP